MKSKRIFNDKEYERGDEIFETEKEAKYVAEELRDLDECVIIDANKNGWFLWLGGERDVEW
jgi:hypothetical protein